MKLVEKKREGSRWVSRHDTPQTAYQRLLTCGELVAKDAAPARSLRVRGSFGLAAEVEKRLQKILP